MWVFFVVRRVYLTEPCRDTLTNRPISGTEIDGTLAFQYEYLTLFLFSDAAVLFSGFVLPAFTFQHLVPPICHAKPSRDTSTNMLIGTEI